MGSSALWWLSHLPLAAKAAPVLCCQSPATRRDRHIQAQQEHSRCSRSSFSGTGPDAPATTIDMRPCLHWLVTCIDFFRLMYCFFADYFQFRSSCWEPDYHSWLFDGWICVYGWIARQLLVVMFSSSNNRDGSICSRNRVVALVLLSLWHTDLGHRSCFFLAHTMPNES